MEVAAVCAGEWRARCKRTLGSSPRAVLVHARHVFGFLASRSFGSREAQF